MKNARWIFINDIKRLRKNIIAILVIIGLCVLPALYAWFNIAATWDPYGNTGNIKVAVVNQDKRVESMGRTIEVGAEIVKSLAGNDSISWEFVKKKRAINGVKKSDYYAAVIIPENFSKNIISFLSGEIKRPEINYYVNEKKNAVAPKITDAAISEIKTQVNDNFVKAIANIAVQGINTADKNLMIDIDKLEADMTQSLDGIKADLTALKNDLAMTASSVKAIDSLLESSKDIISGVGSTVTLFEADLQNAKDRLLKIKQDTGGLLPDVKKALDKQIDKLVGDIDSLTAICKSMDTMGQAAEKALVSSQKALRSIGQSIDSLTDSIDDTIGKIDRAQEKIEDLASSDNLLMLIDIATRNPEKLGKYLSSPVKINQTVDYEIENYGSAMSPFYTSLAIWVGAIIMVAIFRVRLSEEDKLRRQVTLRQEYVGRSLIFFCVSFVQATVIAAGNLLFLEIQCDNVILYLVACWVTAFVFTLIVYTLTVSFGNIGKAIAVIWLVMQVAGSGGTFPIELLPPFFQGLAPFMPFTYAVNAMRETIGGLYGSYYVLDLLRLLGFVPFALLLGLVLRNPLYRLNEFFEEKMHETKFMQ